MRITVLLIYSLAQSLPAARCQRLAALVEPPAVVGRLRGKPGCCTTSDTLLNIFPCCRAFVLSPVRVHARHRLAPPPHLSSCPAAGPSGIWAHASAGVRTPPDARARPSPALQRLCCHGCCAAPTHTTAAASGTTSTVGRPPCRRSAAARHDGSVGMRAVDGQRCVLLAIAAAAAGAVLQRART